MKVAGNALYDIWQEIHYFRNEINYEPPTLVDMLRERDANGWQVLLVGTSTDNFANRPFSLYHMHSHEATPHGEFNTKWMSHSSSYSGVPGGRGDRLFEAIYDIGGRLLNDDTDPINMGSYNYGYSIPSEQWNPIPTGRHVPLDVDPYKLFGNSQRHLDLDPSGSTFVAAERRVWNNNSIAQNHKIAIENRRYNWTPDSDGVIVAPSRAMLAHDNYLLLTELPFGNFRITNNSRNTFVVGGSISNIYEIHKGANAVIYAPNVSNIIRFNFEISGVIDENTTLTQRESGNLYLEVVRRGNNTEIYLHSSRRSLLPPWQIIWDRILISTLYGNTDYNFIQVSSGNDWRTVLRR